MLSVANKPFVLSVFMLNVIMLSVVAPSFTHGYLVKNVLITSNPIKNIFLFGLVTLLFK